MSSESEYALRDDHPADDRRPRRLPVWLRLAGTIGLLGFDVLVAWVLHIGGAALSQLVDVFSGEAGHNRFTAVLREHGIAGLRPEYLGGPLPLDVPTAGYLGLAAVVAIAWVATDRGDRVSRAWGTVGLSVVLVPAILYPLVGLGWVGLELAEGVVNLVARLLIGDPDLWAIPDVVFPLTLGPFLIFVAWAYGFAAVFGINAQGVLLDLWKPSRPRQP